jgi:nicotinate-nucleotide adenylyltransferase
MMRSLHGKTTAKPYRVGIYAGTFDPVHAGHIAFALQAAEQANLDEVIFLPERRPRFKDGPEHFGHRVAMLKRAVKPHAKLQVMEMVDKHFTVKRTLPQLRAVFGKAELVFLVGSDVAEFIPDWAGSDVLLGSSELVVGVRRGQSADNVTRDIGTWDTQPKNVHVIESYAAEVSSRSIREALRQHQTVHGLLESVLRYARTNWLYVSLRKQQ